MKKNYKVLFVLALGLIISTFSYGASIPVKTVELTPAITATGYVRVVIKLTDKFIANDVGIIVHEEQIFPNWNGGMGIMGFFMNNGVPQARGYEGVTPAWELDPAKVKDFAIGDMIALWFKIDAVNDYHSLWTQTSNESSVTNIYTDFISRASSSGSPSTTAMYCTVFYNDRNGDNTDGCVEIVEDPVIVSSVTPYTFATSLDLEASEVESVKVFPTLVQDNLTIASEEDINSVKIYSLTGQLVFSSGAEEVISLGNLSAGAYLVEVETSKNNIVRQKIIKK